MKSSPSCETAESVARLLEQGDSAAAAELALLADSADKALSKSARRALYTLSQRGIHPPVSPSAPAVSARKQLPASRALMSNDGGTGSRMLWFIREDAHGGSPTLMTFLVNDREGVKDLAQRKIPRRELDQRIADLKARENAVIADVSLDYARHVLAESAALNSASRIPLPQGFAEALRYIGKPEQAYPESPVYERLNAGEVRSDPSIPRGPEKLFEQPWCEGWLLDFESVEPWESKYFEAVSSRVLIDESQRAKRGDAIIDEAADALLDADSAARYKRRLEDTALVLHLAGCTEEARQTLYHALTLADFKTPHENPFLRTLVHRSIFLVIAYKAQLEEQAEQARKQSGIIHRP